MVTISYHRQFRLTVTYDLWTWEMGWRKGTIIYRNVIGPTQNLSTKVILDNVNILS